MLLAEKYLSETEEPTFSKKQRKHRRTKLNLCKDQTQTDQSTVQPNV